VLLVVPLVGEGGVMVKMMVVSSDGSVVRDAMGGWRWEMLVWW